MAKKKTTTYELISKLQKLDYYKDLLKQGIIPMTVIDYKLIYEYYCKEKSRGIRHSEAITFTGEEFNLGDRSIYIIIKRMEN